MGEIVLEGSYPIQFLKGLKQEPNRPRMISFLGDRLSSLYRLDLDKFHRPRIPTLNEQLTAIKVRLSQNFQARDFSLHLKRFSWRHLGPI